MKQEVILANKILNVNVYKLIKCEILPNITKFFQVTMTHRSNLLG